MQAAGPIRNKFGTHILYIYADPSAWEWTYPAPSLCVQMAQGSAAVTSITVHHRSLLSAILVASPMFALAHSAMPLSQFIAGLPLPLCSDPLDDGLFQAVVYDDVTMFHLPFPHLFYWHWLRS